jgi:hypothetical protein
MFLIMGQKKSWLFSFRQNPNYIGANNEEEGDTFEEIKEILILALENVTKYTTTYVEGKWIANIAIGDPHLGSLHRWISKHKRLLDSNL